MLNYLTIKGNHSGPHLLITAGVHGDEYEPMEACRRIFQKVKQMQGKLCGNLTIIPVVNQSAFELGSRMGSDDLDLARVCPGNEKGSKTEQVAYALSKLIRTADYYIDMHTGGRLHNIYPFAGYMLHPDSSILQSQRQLAKAFMLPIAWGTEASLKGRTLSVARDADIPAIYTELGGNGIYNETMTNLGFKGCLNVLKHLEMIPEKPEKTIVSHHLEDHRKNSGHLQKMLPSPCDGFYIPTVSFGQRVVLGDIIGHVQDVLGENTTQIEADQAGIVFILRSPPSVKKGDALGAILPANEDNKIQSIYE